MSQNMSEFEFPRNVKKYIRAISRHLRLPKDLRNRVISDLETSIHGRFEAGERYDTIIQSMGSAQKVAAELNEQMKQFAYRKSKWRFPFLVLAILSGLALTWEMIPGLILYHSLGEAESLGIIGGADGPTAIFVTTALRGWEYYLEKGVFLLLLITGIAGFAALSRCKQKAE